MPRSFQVTMDSSDPDALASFWVEALGYQLQPPPEGYETWDQWLEASNIPNNHDASALIDPEGQGPRIYIQRVPEPKSVKNRVHLDINLPEARGLSGDERRGVLEAEAERLTALGARKEGYYERYGESWVIMNDPEGNEFCIQ